MAKMAYAAALARYVRDRLAPNCVLIMGADAQLIADQFVASGVDAVAADQSAVHLTIEKALFTERTFDLVLMRPSPDDRPIFIELFRSLRVLTKSVLFDVSGLDALSYDDSRSVLACAMEQGFTPRDNPDVFVLPLCQLSLEPSAACDRDSAARALTHAFCRSLSCAADPVLLFSAAAAMPMRIEKNKSFTPDLDWFAGQALRRDRVSYAQWCERHEPTDEVLARLEKPPNLFDLRSSFVLACSLGNAPAWMVREMILSVEAQIYPRWQLWLVHDKPEEEQTKFLALEMARVEPRIRTLISEDLRDTSFASTAAVPFDAYAGRLKPTDLLTPFALFDIAELLNRRPYLDVVHSDVDGLTSTGQRISPCFGGAGVFGSTVPLVDSRQFIVVSTNLTACRPAPEDAFAFNSAHIARIHRHTRESAPSDLCGRLDWPRFAPPASAQDMPTFITPNGSVRANWRDLDASTSIVVVAAAATSDVLAAVRQLVELTSFRNSEMLLPASKWGGTLSEPVVGIVTAPDATLLERVQAAVDQSEGEILVFLDIAARPALPDWQREFTGPLSDSTVGIVGARGIDPTTKRIEHAGLIFDIDGRLEALREMDDREQLGPGASIRSYAYRTAIGGAAFSIRRRDFDKAGGFCSTVGFPRIDVDLCLRLRETTGGRVLYNPYLPYWRYAPALLEDWLDDPETSARWLRRHFPAGDPCGSPHFTVQENRFTLSDPPVHRGS